MDSEEVEQLVTDYIISAREIRDRFPDAALMFCRKANECLIHRVYFNHKQEYPEKDSNEKYPHLHILLEELDSFLSDQTKATLYSINAQTRMAVHFDRHRLGKKSEKEHHIEPVIQQLISVYRDVTDEDLHLDSVGSEKVIEKTLRGFVSSNLTDHDVPKNRIDKPSTGDEESVAEINTALDLAENLGIEFNSEDNLQLGEVALQGGHINNALKYFEHARAYSSENEDQLSEISSLYGLGMAHSQTGSPEQSNEFFEQALDIATELEDRGWESTLAYRLGSNYNDLGVPENCLTYLRRSIFAAKKTDSKYLVEPTFLLGIIAYTKGQLEDAERLMNEATEICNQNPEMTATLVDIKIIEGILKLGQGDMDFNHPEVGKWCINRCQELGYRYGEAEAMIYLGTYHRTKNENTLATKLYQDALQIYSDSLNTSGMSLTLRELGWLYFETGDSKQALELTENALQLAIESNLLVLQAVALNNISLIHSHNGEKELAKECLIKSLEINRHMSNQTEIGTCLNNLSILCCEEGGVEEAHQYLLESHQIAVEMGNKPPLALALSNLAEFECDALGEFDSALQKIEASIEIWQSIPKRDQIAASFTVKAKILMASQGDFAKVRLLLNEALEILSTVRNVGIEVYTLETLGFLEAHEENHPAVKSILDRILSLDVPRFSRIGYLREMATCLCRFGRDIEAEGKVKEAMQIAESLGNEFQKLICLNELGLIYMNRGKNEDARGYFEQYYQYVEQNDVTTEIQTGLHNLASVYHNLGNFEKSEEMHKKSISIARESADENSVAIGLNNLGLVYIDMGRLDVALTHFSDSMETALQAGIKQTEAFACANMAIVYSSPGWQGESDQSDSELYEKWTKKSIALRKEIGELLHLPEQIRHYAWFLICSERYDEAKNHAIDLMSMCASTPFEAIGQAHGNNLLGLISDNTDNMDDALAFYSKSLEIFNILGDMGSVATLYYNQAVVYQKLGYHSQYRDLMMKAIDTNRLIGDKEWLMVEINPFGIELVNHNQHEVAELLFDECLSIATEFENVLYQAHSLYNLGWLTELIKRYDESEDFFSRSIAKYEELGEIECKKTAEDALADMMKKRDASNVE